jgi:hypothetical protein
MCVEERHGRNATERLFSIRDIMRWVAPLTSGGTLAECFVQKKIKVSQLTVHASATD